MTINNKFNVRQCVMLRTDKEFLSRMIIGIKACAEGGILYEVACGIDISWHYECELIADLEKKEIGFLKDH